MAEARTLSGVIEEYLSARRSNGLTHNTLRADRSVLDALLEVVGNIQIRNLEARHIDAFFARRAELMDSTRNANLGKLRTFFRWCMDRGFIREDPTKTRRFVTLEEKERLRVPTERFDELLDAAPHPRDRMVIALGLYLFLRSSEIQAIRLGDVDLEDLELRVRILKTKQYDVMPICEELEDELRRWLSWYAANLGQPLEAEMFLCPSKREYASVKDSRGKFVKTTPDTPRHTKLHPTRPMSRSERGVKQALSALGYDTRQTGGHTLRRSGARALFQETREDGVDGALQNVKVMLHHQSVQMTERYLGVAPERELRNARLKGRRMFTKRGTETPDNVVELRRT